MRTLVWTPLVSLGPFRFGAPIEQMLVLGLVDGRLDLAGEESYPIRPASHGGRGAVSVAGGRVRSILWSGPILYRQRDLSALTPADLEAWLEREPTSIDGELIGDDYRRIYRYDPLEAEFWFRAGQLDSASFRSD